MKKISRNQQIKILISFILLVLSVGALFWFIYTFKYISREGNLKIEHRLRDKTTIVNKELAINNIKPWMTFNYLNVIFKLDPTYLKNNLNITDSRYPNMRIDHYARRNHINPLSYLEQIKNIIINYQTTN